MAKSSEVSKVDEIQAALHAALKPKGFRKWGRTFNRTTEDGLVQVINIQMGAYDPPGTVPIPGLRENLYGWFTVNLGVYVPEVAKLHGGGEAKGFVQEYHCCVRTRLSSLGRRIKTPGGATKPLWRWSPICSSAWTATVFHTFQDTSPETPSSESGRTSPRTRARAVLRRGSSWQSSWPSGAPRKQRDHFSRSKHKKPITQDTLPIVRSLAERLGVPLASGTA